MFTTILVGTRLFWGVLSLPALATEEDKRCHETQTVLLECEHNFPRKRAEAAVVHESIPGNEPTHLLCTQTLSLK